MQRIKQRIIFNLLLLLFLGGKLYAQTEKSLNFTLDHLALSVKDADRSVAFYKSVLLLPEITNRTQKDGIRWMMLGDKKELHLISTLNEPVLINKAVHIALTTTNFEAVLQRLQTLQIPYSDWPGKPYTVTERADGIRQLYFQDPDGYWIEVNSVKEDAPTLQALKNDIWQLEENYWKYVQEKDLTSYLRLWDENFIGYPSTNIMGNKDHITDWIGDMYEKNKGMTYHYELIRKTENVFGDIVLVFYDAIQIWKKDKKEVKRSTIKITHTWRKTADGWLIIGGMGAII